MASTSTQLTGSYSRTEDDPDIISARIEETRGRLSNTIDQIQTRLSPDRLKEQVKDSVKEATLGKAEKMAHNATSKANKWGTNIAETAKQHPIPTALVGIGLSWLLAETIKDNSPKEDQYYYRAAGTPQSALYLPRAEEEGVLDKTKSAITYGVSQAQQKVKDAGHAVSEKASELSSAIPSKTGQIAENVQDRVKEQVRTVGDATRSQVQIQSRRARETLSSGFSQNPLAFGAAAIVAGTAIGLLLPATQKENELMGETRDRLVDQAQHTAKETMRKAEQVAREATESAQAEAKQEDIPPGS